MCSRRLTRHVLGVPILGVYTEERRRRSKYAETFYPVIRCCKLILKCMDTFSCFLVCVCVGGGGGGGSHTLLKADSKVYGYIFMFFLGGRGGGLIYKG